MDNFSDEIICAPFHGEIEIFQNWIASQPKFPQNLSKLNRISLEYKLFIAFK